MVLSRDLQRRAQIAAGAVSSLEEVPMRAWVVDTPGPIDTGPLVRIHRPTPVPGRGQVLVRVTCCGVCRTDLHLAEGDLPPHGARTVPGHEVVGVVDAVGPGSHRFRVGDRIGVPWLARTDGSCLYCRRGDENLCSAPQFTGWDLDGGYADACVADEAYVYRLPDSLDDEHAAPLLCAGIIGYRALRRSRVAPGGRLGIYGFGGSAHLTAQVALHLGMRVHVLTRGRRNQELARRLGADSVGDADGTPPGAPGRGHPLRARRRARADRAVGPGPRRHPGRGRYLAVRHPDDWATTTPCSRSERCAASRPTPGRTARSSSLSPNGSRSVRTSSPTRWPTHLAPSRTSPTAGSAVPLYSARTEAESRAEGPWRPRGAGATVLA